MASRYERRSRDAPMDFEFTDRDRIHSVLTPDSPFAAALDASPRKRGHAELAPQMPQPFAPGEQPQRTFAQAAPPGLPFLFHAPPPHTTYQPAWTPPPPFPQPEMADVSMTDASPDRPPQPPPPPQASPSKKKSKAADVRGDETEEEDDEEEEERQISTGALRRVFRKRERERLLGSGALTTPRRRPRRRARDESDLDDDDEDQDGGRSIVKKMAVYLNAPTQNELAHADVPQVLVGYVQFFFNLAVVLVVVYLAVAFIITVQRDVEQRVSEYSLGLIAEIQQCREAWTLNHCADPAHRAPILAGQCAEWQACMARDPTFVGRARVLAEMLGEVVNGFVEPISWKTLIFTLTRDRKSVV